MVQFSSRPIVKFQVRLSSKIFNEDDPFMEVTAKLPTKKEAFEWSKYDPKHDAEKENAFVMKTLINKIVSWDNVYDEEGKEIPYTINNLKVFCDTYPNLISEICLAYLAHIHDKPKN